MSTAYTCIVCGIEYMCDTPICKACGSAVCPSCSMPNTNSFQLGPYPSYCPICKTYDTEWVAETED